MQFNLEKNNKKIIRACAHCNKTFECYESSKKTYCSKNCSKYASIKRTSQVCSICAKKYNASQQNDTGQCLKCMGITDTRKMHNLIVNRQAIIDVCDCISYTDITMLRKMLKDGLFDVDMLLRKCVKLKLSLGKWV